MILLIDNYDSFTFNLYQALEQLGEEVVVHRNDQISLDEIRALKPTHIVLSPGPCTPKESGIYLELIQEFYKEIPVLGVCLGHQAIAMALGGKICGAKTIMHGKPSEIFHNGKEIFQNVTNPFEATRYHSWVASEKDLPKELAITARSEDQEIMAIRHTTYPLFGIQFHPESVLTTEGNKILENFIKIR